MVPLEEYVTVNENVSLYDAVLALEESNTKFSERVYRHRAILVKNAQGVIVGKISQRDVLKGLEPKYAEIIDESQGLSYHGYTVDFLKSIMKSHTLLQNPMENLCRKAARFKVTDIMYTPSEGEYVREDATIDEAIHQLVLGRHQSLLVTRDEKVVGVLRLTDVFQLICDKIKQCAR